LKLIREDSRDTWELCKGPQDGTLATRHRSNEDNWIQLRATTNRCAHPFVQDVWTKETDRPYNVTNKTRGSKVLEEFYLDIILYVRINTKLP